MRKIWQLLTGRWQWFVIYFGGVMTLRILGGKLGFNLIEWWVGGLVGMVFTMVDRLAYVYFTRPHEQLSVQVKDLISRGRYMGAIQLIKMRQDEQQNLAVRSVLFVGAWIPLAFFVLTSSGSLLASGLVMGVGLHLLYDLVADFNQVGKLKQWLFWPVKRLVSDQEVRVVAGFYGVMFVILSLLLV